ncbi:MAG: hypothetical protein K0R57_247 [Paenibacillaceae bacterium]|nr:hypothetical protein [Paenibacillaceae bacterium]
MSAIAKPHLLFISAENPFPQDSGGKLRTGNILRILAQAYSIDLVTYDNQQKIAPAEESVAIHGVRKTVTYRKAMLRSLYTLRNCSYMSHADVDFGAKISELCSRIPYDKVFISHSLLGGCLRLVKKILPDARIITDAHNFETGLSGQLASTKKGVGKHYFRMNALFTKRDEKRVLEHTDLLFTTSQEDAGEFAKLLPRHSHKVHVIPNFIDLKSYTLPPESAKEKFIILPGNMNYFPNVNGALYFYKEIYAKVKAAIPDLKWYIVGRDVNPAVASLAQHDSSVVVTGYVDSVMDYIRRAKVVIAPLLEGSGTRLKILEAWAARTPVVSTFKGAEGLAYQHGQDIFVTDQSSEFADYIIRLVNDCSLNEEIAERAYGNLLAYYEKEAVSSRILHSMESRSS